MKMIWCTCNVSMLDRLTAIITKTGIDSWQVVGEVAGKIPGSDPRMDTPVWPGFNSVVSIQTDEIHMVTLQKELGALNDTVLNQDERIYCWAWNVEEIVQ